MESVGDKLRETERDYLRGETQISDYVHFSMHDTLEKIDAYMNSKHISGETDSIGREKPFFNIVRAAVNVWYRATDIDRKHIRIVATKQKDWINSFLATVHLRYWMRKAKFGQFLNEWGRVLARYGSAVIKFVEQDGELHLAVIPWNRLIVDPVDFDSNIKAEVIELTEAQLRQRIDTHGYDKEQVEALVNAVKARETLDKKKKDNKSNYIKIYEVHGNLPLSALTGDEDDDDKYEQQMHVISYVGVKGKRNEYDDFTLYAGKEKKDPYMITHLIKEDARTLAIGAVENLFESQWMANHSMKSIKDTLDISSRLIFQTADTNFVGRNVLENIESGDILIHSVGGQMELNQVQNAKPDIVSWQNYATQWKSLGNEITGISEAMLGAQPKSGTAWRQTEALLQESHSLFELMTENKALYLEEILRERIIPHIKKKMNTSEEVSATLEQHEIDRIDPLYLKNEAARRTRKQLVEKVLNGESITPGEQEALIAQNTEVLTEGLNRMGNQRFFKPSDVSDKSWKEQFKDLEWDVEVDITGESVNVQQAMTTLKTALETVVQPGFQNNKRAQMIVGRILEMTGAMSPIEYNAMPSTTPPQEARVPEEVESLPDNQVRQNA